MYLHILMVVTKNPIGQWEKYNRSVVLGVQKSNVCDHEIKPLKVSKHTYAYIIHTLLCKPLFLFTLLKHAHTMSFIIVCVTKNMVMRLDIIISLYCKLVSESR